MTFALRVKTMPETKIVEKVKCHFCRKRGYIDPDKPMAVQGWHLHFWGPGEYWTCKKCFLAGKIRCPECGKEARKVGWYRIDDYEIHCDHCQAK